MVRIRAGIVNVTGYVGVELARLLLQHPAVELSWVTGRSAAGQRLEVVFPHLVGAEHVIAPAPGGEVDVIFSAMPHKTSAEVVASLMGVGVRVVDVSADFRLRDVGEYEKWYGVRHPVPRLVAQAVYGLPELHREEIMSSSLVANPGCYPTCAILAMAPAIKEGIVEPDIVVDSKSGVSGAGRSVSLATHYPECNENAWAYALEGHRHLPEIEQELGALAEGGGLSVTFQPHLVPMTRGILSSCYARLKRDSPLRGEDGSEELRGLYRDFYRGATFVRVMEMPPQTKHTWGNNYCLIYPTVDKRTGRLVVISCLDNLVKGGAGQAVQNMNLMFGLPETAGLASMALYP